MLDKVQFSRYDDILLEIIKEVTPGVRNIVNTEFDQPFETWPEKDSGIRHKRLSRAWVKYLAHSLEDKFRSTCFNDNLFALPPNPKTKNISRIRHREFLYDITLGNYTSFQSTVNKKTIWFQSQAVWQIESEFSNNMREIAIDFSKLLAGNATFKMMVGPGGDGNVIPYLTDMAQLAVHCNPELYFLFLSHPRQWYENGKLTIQWQLYKWGAYEHRWYCMKSSKDGNTL